MKTVDFQAIKGNKGENPLKDALNSIRENIQTQLEIYPYIAQCRKAYFDELVKEGFTEVQALEIVKVTTI